MKGKRYSTEEKVRILRDVDAGRSIVDICREKNISDVTYHPCLRIGPSDAFRVIRKRWRRLAFC
ncbi:MAG: transposase [Verrucomicrobia bacterium]|nr:transposase [Verrucomicrobiota bacterium]